MTRRKKVLCFSYSHAHLRLLEKSRQERHAHYRTQMVQHLERYSSQLPTIERDRRAVKESLISALIRTRDDLKKVREKRADWLAIESSRP